MTCDHCNSSTLVGEKYGVSPSLFQRLRHQQSKWMQDGCKIYMNSFIHGIEWIMFHGHLDYFPKPPLGDRPNTKLGDYGTLKSHNYW